jgi:3-oxoacyl-[acyl-carrier protein] reductase
MLLENKVALVTGASRGIGRAIALGLANEGTSVAVHYNKSKEKAEEVVREIGDLGNEGAKAFQTDLNFNEGVYALVRAVSEQYGGIDILVNNAGVNPRVGGFDSVGLEEWDSVMSVNLRAPFFLSQHVSWHMKELGDGGSIINISSNAALRAKNDFSIPYSVSKSGLVSLTKDLARTLAGDGIRVNCIAPGYTMTDMSAFKRGDELYRKISEKIPLGGVNEPKDIAGYAVFLASDWSKGMTGQVFTVDGGFNL